MNSGNHKIDVIIPVYNGEKFISKAIDSVIQQTLKPAQIIIINDGSSDDTEAIILEYEKKYPGQIKYTKQTNKGPSEARNTGIKNSNADYLAFLDSDDEWETNKLELQMKKFTDSDFPNLGLIYCDYSLINKSGTPFKNKKLHITPKIRGNIYLALIADTKISSSASGVLIKRTCFEQCGLFDPKLRSAEDWDLWLRISQKFQMDFCEESLVKLRIHDNNASKNRILILAGDILVLKKQAERHTDRTIIRLIKNSLNERAIWSLATTNSYDLLKNTLTPPIIKKIYGAAPFALEFSLILKFIIKAIQFPFKTLRNYF